MTIVTYRLIGKDGIVLDGSRTDNQPSAFTYVRNVRFRDDVAELMYGHNQIGSNVTAAPYYLGYAADSVNGYWVAAGLTNVYCSLSGTGAWASITRAAGTYSATADARWNGGTLNGILVLNNGVDTPQYWSTPSAATQLQNLTAWPASTRCTALRPHKYFLMAINIIQGAGNYPHRVMWSHPADPGSVPSSWDVTDATKDAGWLDLPGDDNAIDGGTLRDSFIVYKQRSTHLMQHIGGNDIFRRQQIFTESGILTTNCWTELNGTHVVFTASDVIQHDGATANSIIDRKMRRWLFQNIDETYAGRSFVCKQHYFNEVWICFPEAGNTTCNLALVWNWKNNTLSIRDIPNIAHAASGPISGAATSTWASDSDSWASDTLGWNASEFTPNLQRLVMASPATNKLFLADTGTSYSGSAIPGVLERSGLDFGDSSKIKTITRVRPKFKGEGNEVNLYIGSQSDPYGAVTYTNAMPFTIGDDYKADCFKSGRFISFKVESSCPAWQLESIDFDVEVIGEW